MATPLFYEVYGIEVARDADGVYSATLQASELYRNWGAHVYGGCYCIMGNALLQHMAGPGMFGTHYSCRFLRGADIGDTITATADVLKRGRTFHDYFVRVECSRGLAFTMEATYAAASSFPGNAYAPDKEMPAFDFTANHPDGTGFVCPEEPFQTILTSAGHIPHFNKVVNDGRVCEGLYTDERYADVNGFLDASVFCALLDGVNGMTVYATNRPSMTTGITYDLFEPVRPGAVLACAAEVTMVSGTATSTRATLWADGHMVGTCSTSFFSTPATTPPAIPPAAFGHIK